MSLRLGTLALLAAGLVTVVGCDRDSQPPDEGKTPQTALEVEGFTGAAACAECHQEETAQWDKSAHARAMTIATPETVRGDFEQDTTHTYDGQTHHMVRRGDTYYVRTMGRDGEKGIYPVHYTLGARQHETYLTRFPDGRVQVLPVYWDLIENRWYDAAEGTLVFGRSFSPDDWLFWANQGRTWNDRCFDCHASQMRKRFDLKTNTYKTVVGDLSINCETCHGPGAVHTEFWRQALKSPTSSELRDTSLVRLGNLAPDRQVEVCAQCHATKTTLRSGYKPGDVFLDYYEVNLLDDAESFWPDGLVKKLAYPYLQFAGSACFLKADLTCGGCHGDHGSDRTADLTADAGLALCGRCHPGIASSPAAHTFHKPASPGSDCLKCHMPQLFLNYLTVTDHRITSPVPEVTRRLGIPNGCNQAECHSDKSAEWASEHSEAWWGDYQTPIVARAEAVAWGREGDARAIPELTALLSDSEEDPLDRGGAAALLGRIADASALGSLLEALQDPHPVVRWKSAIALGAVGKPAAIPALRAALVDTTFSVRIRAAFSLASLGYAPPDSTSRSAYDGALAEYAALAEGLLADSPNAHVNVGRSHEFRGQDQPAVEAYLRAIRISPGHADAGKRLELMQNELTRFKKLQDMVAPHLHADPRLRVAMGIALVQRGRLQAGVDMLEQARGANLASELLETGLGDAYRQLGQFDRAAAHYERALEIFPRIAGAHRGLALIAYTRGDSVRGNAAWKEYLATSDKPVSGSTF